jgi:hypothetical protein
MKTATWVSKIGMHPFRKLTAPSHERRTCLGILLRRRTTTQEAQTRAHQAIKQFESEACSKEGTGQHCQLLQEGLKGSLAEAACAVYSVEVVTSGSGPSFFCCVRSWTGHATQLLRPRYTGFIASHMLMSVISYKKRPRRLTLLSSRIIQASYVQLREFAKAAEAQTSMSSSRHFQYHTSCSARSDIF